MNHYDKISGAICRPFFLMYIQGVASPGDTVEYSATLDVGIDQNRSTVGITVIDENRDKRLSFRLSIAEAKILASLLNSVALLVRADDEDLEGLEDDDKGDECDEQ